MASSSDLASERARRRRFDQIDGARLVVVGLALALTGAVAVVRAPDVVTVAMTWLVGAASWSPLEYALHRWAFHLPRRHPLAPLGARMHLDHHDAPSAAPIVKPPQATLGAFAALAAVAALLVGVAVAAAAVAGLLTGYAVYELSHVAAHRLDAARHPWPAQRARHLAHHARDRRWFGITSPLWDHVFGTGGRR
jgi:sterol desaturase/sphingolipid hydroxylase (fatty acid hydroxylase superfamily)